MSDKSLLDLRDRVGAIYERCLENTQEISSVFEVLCVICDGINNDKKDENTTTETISKKKRSPRPPKRKTKLNNNTKASTILSPQTPLSADDQGDATALRIHQKKNKAIMPAELFEFYENGQLPEIFKAYAEQKGILSNHVSIYADFVLYHSKKNSKMANWYAAWQTWVRNQIRFQPECLKPSGLAQSNYATSPEDMEKLLAN